MTLIQLISGETLQNVLPILALRPARVVSVLSTASPFFAQRRNFIENAVALALKRDRGTLPSFDESIASVIGSESPSLEETRCLVATLIERFPDAVINYTGGTKEMSIGAWRAAETAGIPSIYCDSPRGFRSGGTGIIEFPIQLPELVKEIQPEIILAAQGLRKDRDWQLHPISKKRIQFGETAFRLVLESPEEIRSLRKTIRSHGLGGSKTKRPGWDDINRAMAHPIPVSQGEAAQAFLQAASEAGLVLARGTAWYLRFRSDGDLRQRGASLENTVTQMDGGAFESQVQSCLQKSIRFRSFLHGVQPMGSSEIADFGETDFLAVDAKNFNLTLISCKSTAPNLEHLESVLARNQKFGGRFARAILCVEADKPSRMANLKRQCENLGITCVDGTELEVALGVVRDDGSLADG
jgi:hypothetical protein